VEVAGVSSVRRVQAHICSLGSPVSTEWWRKEEEQEQENLWVKVDREITHQYCFRQNRLVLGNLTVNAEILTWVLGNRDDKH